MKRTLWNVAALIVAITAGTAAGLTAHTMTQPAYLMQTATLNFEHEGTNYTARVTYEKGAVVIHWGGDLPPQAVIDRAHEVLGWSITTVIRSPRTIGGGTA